MPLLTRAPAEMLPKNTETLKNMNSTTAKFAKWCVRAIDPKVVQYSFTARNEKVGAEKFQCVLVSNAPEQYMLGVVPFTFKDKSAARNAMKRFTADSVWQLTTPAFDSKAKPEFNSCPLKLVVLLSSPTVATRVPPTSQAELEHPAKGLRVALDITGIIDLLKESSGRQALPAAAHAVERKCFDFVGKFTSMGTPRDASKAGTLYTVADAAFMDESGGKTW